MKAIDFVARELLNGDEDYSKRNKSQSRMLISARIRTESIAWIDVLRASGLGESRSEVVQVLLDVAIEQISQLDIFTERYPELDDMVQATMDNLESKLP